MGQETSVHQHAVAQIHKAKTPISKAAMPSSQPKQTDMRPSNVHQAQKPATKSVCPAKAKCAESDGNGYHQHLLDEKFREENKERCLKEYPNQYILVQDGRIKAVCDENDWPNNLPANWKGPGCMLHCSEEYWDAVDSLGGWAEWESESEEGPPGGMA
eukprot:TRINITY_DN99689_c0_g1_i1.p1 TRINITY_DN99689_c0_g1~~TRINITY_DN99689_c0_g1_i1.p1  ORF type:complete len:158 (+),score=16.81 TRINITY_DN99689_c0_g1_i1:56-529(+)